MNTSARNILATLSGLLLLATVGIAVATAGFASTTIVLGLSALVAWALVQMILLDLAPRSTTAQSAQRAEVTDFPRAAHEQPQAA